jgi:hypothetical protein
MTFPPAPRVDLSSLSLGALLGRGGDGQVMAVNGFQINGKWAAALKLYSQAAAQNMNVAVLEKIIALPRQLSSEDGRWLLENTAWPVVIAEDQALPCGFLMRMVPEVCYSYFQTPTQGIQQRLASIQFLLNTDSYTHSLGLIVNDHDRLALLRSVAAMLSRLHSFGAVIGDFSPQNILFSLKPAPSCFLIDCDTVRLKGESVFRQIETPDWDAPIGEFEATLATDAHKFGLLAIRLFARDQSSRDLAAITALSPDLGRLAQLSQDPNPAQRPSLQEWIAVLDREDLAAAQSLPPSAGADWAAAPARSSRPQGLEVVSAGRETRHLETRRRRGQGKRQHPPAVQPNDVVSRAVKAAVKPGLLTFNPPATMVQGRMDRVEVGIARSLELREALATSLRGRGEPQFEGISTSPYMDVELLGAAFEVTSFAPQEQLVAPIARWEFDVRPYRAGRQSLTLCVSLRIDSPSISSGRIAVPVLEREIQIQVDIIFGARRFLAKNWQWLIVTILGLGSALAAWITLLH